MQHKRKPNRCDNHVAYVPARAPGKVRQMTPDEVDALVNGFRDRTPVTDPAIVHVDASGAYQAREGIHEQTNAADRAWASLITLVPVLLFSGVLVWGLAATVGIAWPPALILFGALTFCAYTVILHLNLAHSRPGIERLKIRSAERLERQRLRHAAQLQRQRQQHERDLAHRAMDTYYRALVERSEAYD